MFINRLSELKALEREYRQDSSTFSVVFGRRRVGKTELLTKFIENKPNIYLYITDAPLELQLDFLTREIAQFVDGLVAKHLKFEDFIEAFDFLASLKLERKLVLVIDAYQNIIKQDRAFSSKLQMLWDRRLSKSSIYLILCGSVISMMHSEVLNYSAPLYGRMTSQLFIKAMHFKEIKSFVPTATRLQQMQIFASFGTIPKYLAMYDGNLSFMENVRNNILDKNAYLYSEGNFLLKSEINEPDTYFAILLAISNGNRKIGQIASVLGVNSSYLSKYMQKLIDLDLVEKEIPITQTNPAKSKLGLYRIKDKFLNFWFFYVYKNYNYLEIGQIDAVVHEIEHNFNDRFVSFAFEDYIKEEILLHPTEYIGFVPTKIGRWWSNKEEIDLVAFNDEKIAFIECKWQNSVDKQRVKEQLIKKSQAVSHDKEAYYFVFTKEDYLAL